MPRAAASCLGTVSLYGDVAGVLFVVPAAGYAHAALDAQCAVKPHEPTGLGQRVADDFAVQPRVLATKQHFFLRAGKCMLYDSFHQLLRPLNGVHKHGMNFFSSNLSRSMIVASKVLFEKSIPIKNFIITLRYILRTTDGCTRLKH